MIAFLAYQVGKSVLGEIEEGRDESTHSKACGQCRDENLLVTRCKAESNECGCVSSGAGDE